MNVSCAASVSTAAGGESQVTQLGHVKDLAVAFRMMLGNDKARGQIYNISGERYSTSLVCGVSYGCRTSLFTYDCRKTPLSQAACVVEQIMQH